MQKVAILEAWWAPPNCGDFGHKSGDFEQKFGDFQKSIHWKNFSTKIEQFSPKKVAILGLILPKSGDFKATFEWRQKWRFWDPKMAISKI